MELALSLGDTVPKSLSSFHDKPNKTIENELGFCMAERRDNSSSSDPPVQLDLMPFSPVHRTTKPSSDINSPFNWLTKRDYELVEVDKGTSTCSRGSDLEEENGFSRKKLRLSKEQSAFLEESFKDNNSLNPKQKVALAKQLNLRPRQVEVWFQNRRARTKLKQTEVDCEYLNKLCNTLTEENQRLRKELQELRASKPALSPPTTLTMCPS